MTDLETLQDLLNRSGWHPGTGEWRTDVDSYQVRAWEFRAWREYENCEHCATVLEMSGAWTGELEAHFSAEGTIRHLSLGGD